jgi:hypothetical protein
MPNDWKGITLILHGKLRYNQIIPSASQEQIGSKTKPAAYICPVTPVPILIGCIKDSKCDIIEVCTSNPFALPSLFSTYRALFISIEIEKHSILLSICFLLTHSAKDFDDCCFPLAEWAGVAEGRIQ